MFRNYIQKKRNSIEGVLFAKEKLEIVFNKKYPNNNAKFNISIDPFDGRYTIFVSTKDKTLSMRFPETVDGYRVVIDGVTKLIIPPMDFT